MFEIARLKLTAWYVLIIMLVSLSFSAFIYNGVSNEFQRRLNVIEERFRVQTPLGWRIHGPVHDYFVEDLNEARERVVLILLYANGVIFVISAILGNYLAGKALQPIELAMEEQKRFISDASHELKTPLTALQTSIEVTLRDKNLNLSDAKNALKDSLIDISSLTKLTNDLLSLTRYQHNGKSVSKENLKLVETFEDAEKYIKPIAKYKKINIIFEDKNISVRFVRDDLIKLLTILLDNAVKYTKVGGDIKMTAVKKNRYLTISVKDSGHGIPKTDLPHIFDRFYRAEQSRTKIREDGFGLGLSLAKKIVDLHGGKISVKSKVGKGSIFTVKLPI
jgi:two-component system, OmpR family, sensor histidine kinase CiaH